MVPQIDEALPVDNAESLESPVDVLRRGGIPQERAMSETEPVANDSDPDPLEVAARWRGEGRGVAIATVISTWGSSPRPVGSQLVLDESGRFEGSVSGGCIEGAVIAQGIDAIRTGESRALDFGVSDEQAWEVGLTCGGKVQVYVEPVED